MKSKSQKRVTAMRRGLAAISAMTLMLLGMGPAWGDPATNGEAYAFGLSATGLLPISPTPESRQTGEGRTAQDGDVARDIDAVLRVPLTGLVVDATASTLAEVSLAGNINETIAVRDPKTGSSDPIEQNNVNVHSYAAVTNLDVLTQVTTGLGGLPADLVPQLTQALVDINLIEAEAVAKCVNNAPVFDTGFNIVGEAVAGVNLDIVEGLLEPVLSALQNLLPGIVAVQRGVVEPVPNGIRITALRLNILNGTSVINLSTAEAKMTSPCGIAPPPPPKAQLAVTGGGGMTSLLGAGLLMAAVLTIVLLRRSQIQE